MTRISGTDSVWIKRECPRASERVDKLMENAQGVSHNLTTLIHPSPTLRCECPQAPEDACDAIIINLKKGEHKLTLMKA